MLFRSHHGVAITDGAVVAAARLADRYIADRCLPDSAIDLIDEAAAQLRMEVTSKPRRVEEAEAELRRVELALLAAETAPQQERLALQEQRRQASEGLQTLQQRWQGEREQLEELRQLLADDETLRLQIAEAERDGDLEEAARLQYDQLHGVQQRRQQLEQHLLADQASGRSLLREQVEEGDIADVVARSTGIPVQRLLALGWGLSATLGAVAGMLIAPIVYLDPNMMAGVLLYGFAAALLGGIDNPWGAAAGGLIVGLLDALVGAWLVGPELKLSFALAIIVAVLLVRPAGLFGRATVIRV